MEITAHSNESYKAHKCFFNLTTKNNNILNKIFKILLPIFSVLSLLLTFFYDKEILPLSILIVFCTLLYYFIDIFMPLINYKLTKISSGLHDILTFYDDEIKVTTQSKNLNSESTLNYDVLKKVYETTEYFFVYISHQQAFIVDKSTISGGTEEQLRNYLIKAVGDKKYKYYYK